MPCFCLSRFTLLLLFLYFLPLPFPPSSRGHESIKKEGGERGLRFVACACVCLCCVENGVKWRVYFVIRHKNPPPTQPPKPHQMLCFSFKWHLFASSPPHLHPPHLPPFLHEPPPRVAGRVHVRAHVCMHAWNRGDVHCLLCFACFATHTCKIYIW